MSSRRDYYEVLGVERGADGTVIKRAYRKLAMEYHPDRNPDKPEAEEGFREIQEAYSVLSDPQKRGIYDQFGHAGLRGASGGPQMDDIFDGFQSIFDDFFGGGSSRNRRARGADLQYRLQLSFREAILGTTKTIKIPRRESCSECSGSGAQKGSSAETCPTCQGAGKVRAQRGFFTVAQACPQCSGAGKIIKNPCKKCVGSGLESKESDLEVNIPAGVDSGIRLRMYGEGEAPPQPSGERGDLYVEIHVEEDEVFERDGTNLYCRVYVPFPVAVLGGEVEVPLVEGTSKVKIPKATKTPYVHQLYSEGVTSLRDKTRGNLFVEFLIDTPEKLSPKAKELIEELSSELQGSRNFKSKESKSGFFSGLFD